MQIYPEIKSYFSPDVDLDTYIPEDTECFGFLLQLLIGPKNLDGEESFDVFICTPKWLQTHSAKQDIVFGYHHIIVFKYDLKCLIERIEKHCTSITGNNWYDVAQKLSVLGNWEFEDYKHTQGAASKVEKEKSLYTFFADFEGGTNISQILAVDSHEAKCAWSKKFSKEILAMTSDEIKRFIDQVNEERAILLEGLVNVWCFCPIFHSKTIFVHFVVTAS